MAPPCIFLSRHGESEYMLDAKIGGDSCLTAKGREYALQLPQLILQHQQQQSSMGATSSSNSSSIQVLTSTLQRTIQTAAHLPFKQQRVKALDEINAGICEHMTYEQVAQVYPDVHQARSRDKLGYRYPEGESYLDLVARLWPVVHQLEQRQAPVVVVAHQAVLRVLVGLLLRKPLQDMPMLSIPLHTLMELTPTTDGRSYNMTCTKAVMPTTTATAAHTAAAEPVAAVPASSLKAWQSSAAAGVVVAVTATSHSQAFNRQRWVQSCTAELTAGLQAAHASSCGPAAIPAAACST